MLTKALLLATLTVVNGNDAPTVSQTSNVLSEDDMCPSAMQQIIKHNGLQNNIYSTKRAELKARKLGVHLVVTCEVMKGK